MFSVNFRMLGQLGLVLFLTGVFLSWKLQSLRILPQFIDIGLVLILSMLFIFTSYRKRTNECVNVFVFVLLVGLIGYGLIASIYIGDMKNTVWSFFGLVTLFVFSKVDYSKIYFDRYGVCFSIFMCLLFISETGISGLSEGLVRQSVGAGNAAYGLAAYCAINALVLTTASISGVLSKWDILLVGFSFVCSFVIILISGVRSPLFGFFLCTSFLLFRLFKNSRKEDRIPIILVILIVVAIFFSASNVIDEIIASLLLALDTLFGTAGYYADAAAQGRNYQREEAISLFSDNLFFGVGFKYFWVDFPLLQMFSDSGLILGLIYLFVYFIYPFYKSISSITSQDPRLVFFSLLYLCNVPRLYLHGQPFDWQHMVFVLPVVCFFVFYEMNSVLKSKGEG